MLGRYLWGVLIAVDQLFNALLAGDPNETISSRMGRWQSMGGWRTVVAKPVCWSLHKIDPGHCGDNIDGKQNLFDE